MASYFHNYGQFEYSYYYGVNGHINPKLQNSETQDTTTLEHLIDEEELSPQPISDSKETVNAATLKSVELDEFSIVNEYLSKSEETLEVSSHELDITIAQNKDNEADKRNWSHFRKAGGAADRERGRPTSDVGETTHPLMHTC
ncbi:hypothetical protein Scep_006664 [Stephania cephalantha]|uniref:Uncharacterized protein n=1 Tax=Stephania cephalantha TaxID=152367 RepID=A0AAP0PL18_9MAGN